MRSVEPEVFLVARPKVDYEAMAAYLREVGGERWLERIDRGQLEAQDLAEFAGKIRVRADWQRKPIRGHHAEQGTGAG